MNVNLVQICHACDKREEKCAGRCLCTVNGKDIITNVKNNNCPENKFIEVANRPPVTGQAVVNYAIGQLSGKRVSLEITEERVATCNKCPYIRQTFEGVTFCSIGCGCVINPRRSAVVKSITEVEEKLPRWGCKFPDRNVGGWKR